MAYQALRARAADSEPADGWAYHATTWEALPAIAAEGLRAMPQRHEDEERGIEEDANAVFFSPTARHAAGWGPVVVRFPWPQEYDEDRYGDTVLLPDGSVARSAYWTPHGIPPDQISAAD